MRNTGFRPRRADVHFNVSRMLCAHGRIRTRRSCWRPTASQRRITTAIGNFSLAATSATVSAVAGIAAPEVKVIHQRPALIQELTWRPRYAVGRSPSAEADATEQIVFSFYNDRLFRLTVNYDRRADRGADRYRHGRGDFRSLRVPGQAHRVEDAADAVRVRGGVGHACRAMGRRRRFARALPIVICT